jgi:quinol monooxygenase YgiN
MTENVILAVEFAIIPGRFEDFKTLAAEMIESTQHNEPGTLNYEWAISDDRQSSARSMNASGTPSP